jgi:GNAT superfamily N-acetyltransferase
MPSGAPGARRIEALAARHDRGTFHCGVPELDRYLREQASQDQRRKVAACYVAVDPDAPKLVLGYYTLSAYSVRLQELPRATIKQLPRYPDVPAALIGRLAVAADRQGQRLGEQLLVDALERTLALRDTIGVFAVVVDALSVAAAGFYGRFGFIPFPGEPLRLFLPLATIEAAFAAR